MKIDTRKLRKLLNKMIAELDKEPKVKKEFGNDLRSTMYGIGTLENYTVSIELIEFDCPASEFAHASDVVSGERDA
jgi:hypothetical protein